MQLAHPNQLRGPGSVKIPPLETQFFTDESKRLPNGENAQNKRPSRKMPEVGRLIGRSGKTSGRIGEKDEEGVSSLVRQEITMDLRRGRVMSGIRGTRQRGQMRWWELTWSWSTDCEAKWTYLDDSQCDMHMIPKIPLAEGLMEN